MTTSPIYLDHHATTPVDPVVLQGMLPYFTEKFGNPASQTHSYGWIAEAAVTLARQQVAQLMAASPSEIVFTSGATESNNLALQGIALMHKERGNHIITSTIEHKSILETCAFLETQGFEVTYLKVTSQGLIDLNELKEAITPKTILVSIQWANNEIGTIQPLSEISAFLQKSKILFHSDATQVPCYLPMNVQTPHLDLVSLSGHKIYGPKGTGALFVRRKDPRVDLQPMFFGGAQEKKLRAGTLNVPGIVGLGLACELAKKQQKEASEKMKKMRDHLWMKLKENLPFLVLNGCGNEGGADWTHRLPNNLSFSIPGKSHESVIAQIHQKVALSSGSACTSEESAGSHVLKALNLNDELLQCVIRIGLGRFNTQKEITEVIDILTNSIKCV